MQRSAQPSLVVAVVVCSLAGLTWWQMRRGVQSATMGLPTESWEDVKVKFPLPEEPSVAEATVTDEVYDTLLNASPFSAERSLPPPKPVVVEGEAATPQPPAPPEFIYKGRVILGSRQRAILQDRSSGKTLFLEVGQVVAGFKLLDIAEKQVILSNSDTNDELVVPLAAIGSP